MRPLAWVAGVAMLLMLAAIWANGQVLEAAEGQFNRTADFVLLVTGQEAMGAAITLERVAETFGLMALVGSAALLISLAKRKLGRIDA